MDLSLFLIYACALSVTSVLLSVLRRMKSWKSNSASKRFPGPTQFPLIGRVHDLPMTSTWLKFKEWADQYGAIYETSMMGQKFIVISDEDMATDLMVKKGNSFSGRAQIRALIDHKTGPTYVALQDRNETWRTQRKWVHAAMAASSQNHFHGHIDRELRRYLMTLLVDPANFHSNTRELTGRIMARLAWDDAAQAKRYGEEATKTLRQMSISGNIVNAVTPLWHIADFVGYNPWRKYEAARESNMTAWWRQSLQVIKKRYAEGTLPSDTWSYRYLEQLDRDKGCLEQSDEDEHAAACMLGFQNMVGVITVAGPLQYFLMAMVLHPEWQGRVQKEIDAVCGERMPTIDDYAALPTLRACIKETLRWRSTVPLGVPHLCEQDEEYMGVQIKKGTIILACEWALNRVPSKYPDPETYRPDRWLEPEWPTYMEPLSRYPNLREGKGMHTFGWGRRQCLGQSIADEESFLFGATVCWAYNLSLKKCPITGDEIQFDNQATNSHVILEPTPWPMDIKPRMGRAGAVLREYEAVRDELRV